MDGHDVDVIGICLGGTRLIAGARRILPAHSRPRGKITRRMPFFAILLAQQFTTVLSNGSWCGESICLVGAHGDPKVAITRGPIDNPTSELWI
jgi:hypothetical protein